MNENTQKYDAVKDIIEEGMAKNVSVKRQNGIHRMSNLRKYHLTEDELNKIQTVSDKFPNPFIRKGIYKTIIDALIELGVDEWHSFKTLKDKIKIVMSAIKSPCGKTMWDRFENKPPRNLKTAKDINGRIMENILVLQRLGGLNCYGYKLKQLKSAVDIKLDNGIYKVRLNTKFESEDDVAPYRKLK